MKRSYLAAALSFVPGVGQMFLGHWRRGITLLVSLPALGLTLWAVGLTGLIPLIAPVWLWGIFDAYLLACKKEPSVALPVVLSLLIALIASWYITEVNVGELIRNARKNGGMITSQLIRPELRDVKEIEETAATGTLVVYEGQKPNTPIAEAGSGPVVAFDPPTVIANQRMKVEFSGFPAGKTVAVYRTGRDLPLLQVRTDAEGRAEAGLNNPIQEPGSYSFDARIIRTVATWAPSETLRLTSLTVLQTVFMALLGTALSIVLAIPLSFLAARNLMKGSLLGWSAYSTTRLGFNVVRSFEVLVIAVVLVGIVGPGPFAGVLALAIHGVGAIGKLYSEAIESIESGPLEAIAATGASKLQVVIFGVIPQVVPQFVSFTMYRWDINVRMATVIGLVGGGGVGQLLIQYIGLTQWTRAATAIWMIAIVVMLMDYLSAVIREKLV